MRMFQVGYIKFFGTKCEFITHVLAGSKERQYITSVVFLALVWDVIYFVVGDGEGAWEEGRALSPSLSLCSRWMDESMDEMDTGPWFGFHV